jgi:hypothetical protein
MEQGRQEVAQRVAELEAQLAQKLQQNDSLNARVRAYEEEVAHFFYSASFRSLSCRSRGFRTLWRRSSGGRSR